MCDTRRGGGESEPSSALAAVDTTTGAELLHGAAKQTAVGSQIAVGEEPQVMFQYNFVPLQPKKSVADGHKQLL